VRRTVHALSLCSQRNIPAILWLLISCVFAWGEPMMESPIVFSVTLS
jgi:hypothetical protein